MNRGAHEWIVAAIVVSMLSALAAEFVSCSNPNFASPSQVTAPRILDIVAEPPEIIPGQLTVLHAITGRTSANPQFRWFVCARPEASSTFTAQSTFGVAMDDEGCFGDAAVQLGPTVEGPQFFFSIPANILQDATVLRAIYGASLSVDALLRIVNVAGIPVTIAVEMTDGSTVIRAIKRVVVSQRTMMNTNPPAPSFRFGVTGEAGVGGVHLSGRPDDPETCATDNNVPLIVHHSDAIQIAPDTNTADWLQPYDAIDSSGNVQHTMEVAYYSFFTTAGSYEDDRTRTPIQNTIWHAPATPGTITLWLIVRDGRGGSSGCSYPVSVL